MSNPVFRSKIELMVCKNISDESLKNAINKKDNKNFSCFKKSKRLLLKNKLRICIFYSFKNRHIMTNLTNLAVNLLIYKKIGFTVYYLEKLQYLFLHTYTHGAGV